VRNIRIADPSDRVFQGQPAAPKPPSRVRDALATLPLVLLVPALVLTLYPVMAAAGPTLTATPSPTEAGARISVRGEGFAAGQRGSLILDDSTFALATYRVGGNGKFRVSVVIPQTIKAGNHRVRALRAAVVEAEATLAILDPTTPPTSRPTESGTPTVAPAATPTTAPPAPAATPSAAPAATPTVAPTAAPAATPTTAPVATPTAAPVNASWSEEFSSGLGAFSGFTHVYGPTIRVDAAQCTVSGGTLHVTERFEGNGSYVSCMALTTKTFDHGYFEARLSYPTGTGFDAAFWLRRPLEIPSPRSEIDIVEAYPNDPYVYPGPNRYQATMHYVSGTGLASHQITYDAGASLADAWHVFAAEWLPNQKITFYLDGQATGTISADVLSPTTMNIVFSLGVGTWSSEANATTPTSATMLVDWVRWSEFKP
jgi:beta-glucanase (GH16 family)